LNGKRVMEPDQVTHAVQSALTLLTEHLLRSGKTEIYRRVALEVDRAVLNTVLRLVKGKQTQASEVLGISRTTLRAKLRAAGIAADNQPLHP
jgi:DNA-binding protein Fis